MQAFFLAGATAAEYTTLNDVIASGKYRGLFSRPTLSADGASVVVGPHAGLFPNNFYVREDSTNYVSAPAFSDLPSVFTVAWVIDPAGYQQPQLTIVSGSYTQDSAQMLSYLVLGWLFHPGANLTLSSDMLVTAPQAGPENVVADVNGLAIAAAFKDAIVARFGNLTNAPVAVTYDVYGTCTLTSVSSAADTYSIDIPVSAGSMSANSLRVETSLSSQANVDFIKLYDNGTDQTATLIQEGSISGLLARGKYQIPLIRYQTPAWSTWILRVQLTLNPGSSATFTRICATTAAVTTLVQN